ncbi:hypothetical protein O1611_g9003 [Lasiodiplodia mahajangana]|uniref:Uncharacterized protein n=1 Tax=Lasiodiplodia mahajangana TaxID=1108764 RepID=A0ACC2JB49_9PEZI|nr:hypothetical protein O1611_g9003 [Lasiodiplodia mahajangana]
MGGSNAAPPQFPMSPQQQQFGASSGMGGGAQSQFGANLAPAITQPIDGWFNLEPTGAIHLSLNFLKQNKDRRPVDLGLGRKGAIRQRKEEVHEKFGHNVRTANIPVIRNATQVWSPSASARPMPRQTPTKRRSTTAFLIALLRSPTLPRIGAATAVTFCPSARRIVGSVMNVGSRLTHTASIWFPTSVA